MILAIRGSAEPPDWVEDLLLAKEWGIPPWEVEDNAPEIWVRRWEVFQAERNRGSEKKSSDGWLL